MDDLGYTGHDMDADTGLTYMQQRYYDSVIGRFLSNDPVSMDAGSGGNFNRYWYANNNPYRFVDPDGRMAFLAAAPLVAAEVEVGVVAVVASVDAATIAITAVGATASVYIGSKIVERAYSNYNVQSGERESKTPNRGEPGSVHVNPGSGQERLYGEDGYPAYDVDYDHDHGGSGKPHDHEWTRDADGKPVRQPPPNPKPPTTPTPKPEPPTTPAGS